VDGQTKEDAKRDEMFFYENLASTEIIRVLYDKVFTNFKCYNKDVEYEAKKIKHDDNLIIKGNNVKCWILLQKLYGIYVV